ncbi:hypothetical protein TELCIR_05440, partial [Teladorsagia circumcincta]
MFYALSHVVKQRILQQNTQRNATLGTPIVAGGSIINGGDNMNNCTGNYSARLRSRTKQPVYTSDKRAKFAQRENKKWIRFVTVLGYIFFVSLPAVSLSIYYIYIWDPGYINKFPPEVINSSLPIHKTAILSTRLERNADPVVLSSLAPSRPASNLGGASGQQSLASESPHKPDLAAILAEGELKQSVPLEPDILHSSQKLFLKGGHSDKWEIQKGE